MGRKNDRRLEWALGKPEIGVDQPVRKVSPSIRRVLISSLEHSIEAGAHQCSTLAAARVLRGLKVAEELDAVDDGLIRAAAQARLEEMAADALG